MILIYLIACSCKDDVRMLRKVLIYHRCFSVLQSIYILLDLYVFCRVTLSSTDTNRVKEWRINNLLMLDLHGVCLLSIVKLQILILKGSESTVFTLNLSLQFIASVNSRQAYG